MGEMFQLLTGIYIIVVIGVIALIISLMFRLVKAVEKIAYIYEKNSNP